ncbi:unnamed protein product [Closterium sp. NIES-64]|nr:unnamed protein product [Closterium sp. NIES-64]
MSQKKQVSCCLPHASPCPSLSIPRTLYAPLIPMSPSALPCHPCSLFLWRTPPLLIPRPPVSPVPGDIRSDHIIRALPHAGAAEGRPVAAAHRQRRVRVVRAAHGGLPQAAARAPRAQPHALAPRGSKEPLRVIQLRRFNFWGVEAESRREPVLDRLTSVAIHTTTAPPESVATAPRDVLHVNHFTATAIDLAQHPCRSWVKPVLDQGLTWVTPRALKCRALPCRRSTPLECWLFCILPWQGEEDGRRGGAGGGGGLRVAKPENVESGEGEKSKEPAEDTM